MPLSARAVASGYVDVCWERLSMTLKSGRASAAVEMSMGFGSAR